MSIGYVVAVAKLMDPKHSNTTKKEKKKKEKSPLFPGILLCNKLRQKPTDFSHREKGYRGEKKYPR